MKVLFVICSVLICFSAFTQEKDTILHDSLLQTKAVQFHMGFDWYYTNCFSDKKLNTLPFFVSFGNNRELQQNLVYADLKLEKKRYRAHVVPALGTFMEQNSSAEKGIFRNILEANLGIRPLAKKEIWIDAGVLGSPYTNENPFSQEHLTLTRTLAAEYVPYYLAGVRSSWQITNKWKACVFLLNGWQQIADVNKNKSIGTQVEFKPNDRDVFNWNTYLGKEGTAGQVNYGMRYFSDVFWTHGFSENISAATCVYGGIQQDADKRNAFWWQANTSLRYSTKKYGSVSLRGEVFNDPNNAIIPVYIPGNGFHCVAYSVGYGYHLLSTMLVRIEYRQLQSMKGSLYEDPQANSIDRLDLVTAALTFWF